MSIDWERFAERVAAGTRVRFSESERWGILQENAPSVALDRAVRMYQTNTANLDKIAVVYFDDLPNQMTPLLSPSNLQYLIDDKWQTFDELMA